MNMSVQRTTIVPVKILVGRELDHRPEAVFSSYADIEQRARWRLPPDDAIFYGTHDFRVGGTDRFIHGPTQRPICTGITRYEHIVDDDCIVFTERLVDPDDQLLTISLVAWSIAPTDSGALLEINDQTISVAGSRPVEEARYRYEIMLDRLALHLADRSTTNRT